MTLTYHFTGSPAIYTDYPDADLYESDCAVAIAPRGFDRPGSQIRRLYLETRTVTLDLDRIDSSGRWRRDGPDAGSLSQFGSATSVRMP